MEYNCKITINDLLGTACTYYKYTEWYNSLVSDNVDFPYMSSPYRMMLIYMGHLGAMIKYYRTEDGRKISFAAVEKLRRFYRRLLPRTDALDLDPYLERYWKSLINE